MSEQTSRTRHQARLLLVGMVRQCNEFNGPFDADDLLPALMQVWAFTGAFGDVQAILERIEHATVMDEQYEGADANTYRAVMADLLSLRILLGLER